jgi:predicted nucleic acid-binding protein
MATRVADLVTTPDRVMLDTNVLIAATDEGRAEHRDALLVVNDWASRPTELCTSGQILREYLTVATRPAEKNGLGLNRSDALGNVHAIRGRTTLLAEDAKVADRLLSLLADVDCRGKQVHDANVVATMLVYGVRAVVTTNMEDFARFEGHVSLIRL